MAGTSSGGRVRSPARRPEDLKHGLASPELLSAVTGTTVWHINADEPDLIGRLYTITYEAVGRCGNRTTASAMVTVPRSRGK